MRICDHAWLAVLLVAGCGQRPALETGPPLSESEKAQAAALTRLAEVEQGRISPDQQRRLVRLAGEHKCPCPEAGGTLGECAETAREKGGCVRAAFAVRAIVRGLVREDSDRVISSRLLERFGPREPEELDLVDVPCRGRADAPVTMVVFSDFQCPFCGLATKLVEVVEKEAGHRLRFCYKCWPLTSIHPKAQLAAQAAVAAQLQGKFWPMHDQLYANQKDLDRDDLLDHARELGLDLQRFEQDLDSEQVRQRVAKHAAEAERLQLTGTPSFLINGRRMTDPKTVPDFLDWIAEAIALRKAGASSRPASQPIE
jgi:hypothetical protein